MDLTEAAAIKKRWEEYTEELYKKDLHNQDNHDGMITHLEPDILECEVKWALQLGGPAQFLRPELGSGEEGFAARAQARKRHHLAGRGPLSSEGPDPQPGPTPTP